MVRRMATAACVLTTVLLAGCQQTIYDKTASLEIGLVQQIKVEAPNREQKVKVEFSSPGVPIDVWVLLQANEAAVKEKLLAHKRPADADLLAAREGADSGTLEATVPAGKAYEVMVSGARKKTDVKVRITGG